MTQTTKRIILRKLYKPSKYFLRGSGVTFVVMLYVNGNRIKTHFGRHASLVAQLVKNLPATWETWVWSLGWEDPWRRERLPTPVFWPGEFHGLYSPWGVKRVGHDWVTFTLEDIEADGGMTQLKGRVEANQTSRTCYWQPEEKHQRALIKSS